MHRPHRARERKHGDGGKHETRERNRPPALSPPLLPHARRSASRRARKKAKESAPKSPEEEAEAALKAITPSGMSANEAGRALFSGEAAKELRAAVGLALETVPPTDSDEREAEAFSLGLAVSSLDGMIGEEWRHFHFAGRRAYALETPRTLRSRAPAKSPYPQRGGQSA